MIWLLHFRVGHPNFKSLKVLHPELFSGLDLSIFQCEFCELSKSHHVPFPIKKYFMSFLSPLYTVIFGDLLRIHICLALVGLLALLMIVVIQLGFYLLQKKIQSNQYLSIFSYDDSIPVSLKYPGA